MKNVKRALAAAAGVAALTLADPMMLIGNGVWIG